MTKRTITFLKMGVVGLISPFVYYFWHHVGVPLFHVFVAVLIIAFIPMLFMHPFWAFVVVGVISLYVKCTLRNVKQK